MKQLSIYSMFKECNILSFEQKLVRQVESEVHEFGNDDMITAYHCYQDLEDLVSDEPECFGFCNGCHQVSCDYNHDHYEYLHYMELLNDKFEDAIDMIKKF